MYNYKNIDHVGYPDGMPVLPAISSTSLFSRTEVKDVLLTFHQGQSRYLVMRDFKRGFGEGVMDGVLNKAGQWVHIPPSYHGIDGLYIRLGENRVHILVAEAKYGTSQLGYTKHGRQMSPTWIRHNLAKVSERIAGPHGQVIRAAADGKISYRARLFRYQADGGYHSITIDDMNGQGQTIRAPAEKLPREWREVIYKEYQKSAKRMGYSDKESEYLAEKWLENPKAYDHWSLRSRWSWRYGFDRNMVGAGVGVSLMAMLVDVYSQYRQCGEIELDRTLKIGGASGVAGMISAYASRQSYWFMTESSFARNLAVQLGWQRATVVGMASLTTQAMGPAIVAVVSAYAMYGIGILDLRDANRLATSGVAGSLLGAGFSAGLFGAVSTFGVASTGTAISTLSGAAATNATLAAIGGGSIAAGGGGVAVGTAILSGGTTVLILAGSAAVMMIYRHMDVVEKHTLIWTRIRVVERRVEKGDQYEWSYSSSSSEG